MQIRLKAANIQGTNNSDSSFSPSPHVSIGYCRVTSCLRVRFCYSQKASRHRQEVLDSSRSFRHPTDIEIVDRKPRWHMETLKAKKPPKKVELSPEQRLLVDRRNAAQYLSISQRSLDYLLAAGELNTRRIGARVLIPISELQRFAKVDHKRIAI